MDCVSRQKSLPTAPPPGQLSTSPGETPILGGQKERTDGPRVPVPAGETAPERVRIKGPSVVGDLKTNLDDIKSSLVSYYSRLYSGSSPSIEERLDALSFQSQNPESPSRWLRRRQREKRFEAMAETSEDSMRDHLSGGRDVASARRRCDEPAVGQRSSRTSGEVYDMLRDLRLKCETASLKLNTISDDLYPQISNPNLREWEYTTTPLGRRRPQFGDQTELRHHATSLYRHLHTQAEINQSRINNLQSKMKILYMQTKSEMMKHQQDPRVGL
uniref:Uncharacterized protein n=1 Tax=Toxoplasma gondii COUG TaxID=1074873 RepID=A0A2G8XMD5_TOXGO|nr:hypothetical protein TGCOUG_307020 [Toxoplasma gondii COUG]